MSFYPSYTTTGVCYVQINRNSCVGVPQTVAADGDSAVIILGTAGDATELELSEQYATQAAQSDGPCWSSPASKTKTGAQATLRWCSTTFLDTILMHGLHIPTFDLAGNIKGWAGQSPGAGSCCNCNAASCASDGFSVISVSCPKDCVNNQITDALDVPLWEYTVITQVTEVTEVQNRRRSVTPSNNRVDYQYELAVNAGYGTGPGGIFAADAVYDDLGATLTTDAMVFLSTQAPPTVDCPCPNGDDYVGQFSTAAGILAGNPTPLGG